MDIFVWLLNQLSAASSGGQLTRILLSTCLVAITLYLVLKALTLLLENLLKCGAFLGDLGIHTRISPGARDEIRRRRQFCRILDSDLATLAKAENWNDQYLAELEAEVEAEGEYYLTRVHQALHWKSRGIRRVNSLIDAIERSSERRILVVGDPGSGKSVALRHLASVYARRGMSSRAPLATIPLYINLREFENLESDLSTSDVKKFVLANVRRGDSDTADFVREKWEQYKTEGHWLFLFDSFDEIPSVLHAPSESRAIRNYADAIRNFLDSAPNCRAVVASREFKSPRDLPWHRFRILPLTDSRQEQLINLSYVSVDKRDLIKRHVAVSDGTTFKNPMLLSLLCRYVKKHGASPRTDFDLLWEHLGDLAHRDPEFLADTFALTPQLVLDIAAKLARALAESPHLGLSPTIGELEKAMNSLFGADNLGQSIAALVDLKIARLDVPSINAGERRFAFAHRRYQETLYVTYLREHGVNHRPREFLTAPSLREYAVTYLQSQRSEIVAPVLRDAVELLKSIREQMRPIFCNEPVGKILGYYDLSGTPALHVLQILKEGMSARLGDIPEALQDAVYRIVRPLVWRGDALDMRFAAQFSCLIESRTANGILKLVLRQDLDSLDDAVTQGIAYRGAVPKGLQRRFLRGLSDAVLTATTKVQLFRLEAMAARLPSSSGASIVFRRSRRLRSALVWPRRFTNLALWPMRILEPWKAAKFNEAAFVAMSAPAFGIASMLLLGKGAAFPRLPYGSSLQEPLVMLFMASMVAACALLTVQIVYRASPRPLTLTSFFMALVNFPRRLLRELEWTPLLAVLLALIGIGVLPGAATIGIAWLFGVHLSGPDVYIASATAVLSAIALLTLIKLWVSRSHAIRSIKELMQRRRQELRGNSLPILLEARSCNELFIWITTHPTTLLPNDETRRSLLRLLRVDWVLNADDETTLLHPLVRSLLNAEAPSGRRASMEYLISSIGSDFL
jgi:hypothetical protein